ncbi:MAG: hypothetical protein C0421_08580 [Hyphomonas sp.]|uniref:ABC transporter ATP-binding protein n=1 Tax=Hyphomonas sp. TaxID=87 RepID=UPI0025C3C153|nr:ABC transporter ATP-binding protein [Hyphomonas sp.]MBA4338886.1 hypothetical protein [Hyphomonas sp.]
MPSAALSESPMGVDAGLLSAQLAIEDLVARACDQDALGLLQDLIANYAPGLRDHVMDLRRRHEAIRIAVRSGKADPSAINGLRNEILELVFETADHAQGVPATATISSLAALPAAPEMAGAAFTPGVMAAPPKKAAPRPPVPDAPANVICRLTGVSRSYGKGRFRLDPVTLDIRAGEITAVVGRNASGKTTLLRMIMGDLLPTEGSVDYPALEGGRKRRDWKKVKSDIAFVSQLPEKWHGRLLNNLNYVAAAYGKRDQDLEKFIDWHIARYGLLPYREARWDEISGGYKIRFELARALISQPRLLVLDEPLAYLDVIAREQFLRDLRAIANARDNPVPIIITSQHLNETEWIADQIVLLDDGRLKYSGKVHDIAEGRRFKVIEIALDAAQADVEMALTGASLQGIEPTMEGYILAFPKSAEMSPVFTRLVAAFGPKFYMIRDISGSVRSIMSGVGE